MNDLEKEILDEFFGRLEADEKFSQKLIDNLRKTMENGAYTVDDLSKIMSANYTEEKE